MRGRDLRVVEGTFWRKGFGGLGVEWPRYRAVRKGGLMCKMLRNERRAKF